MALDEFVTRWRSELKKGDVVWGGRFAVSELRRKGIYDFLVGNGKSGTGWQSQDLCERIVDEISDYLSEAKSLTKSRFDKIDAFLQSLAEKVRKHEEKAADSTIKALLKRLQKDVEKYQRSAERLRQERRDWHFGAWKSLWPEVPRKNLVVRRIDLDTRLQVEVFKVLADYLGPEEGRKRVNLETIARLVLLVYLAAGLAHENETGIIVAHATGVKVSVRNIRENVRNAGLHKAKGFRQGA